MNYLLLCVVCYAVVASVTVLLTDVSSNDLFELKRWIMTLYFIHL